MTAAAIDRDPGPRVWTARVSYSGCDRVDVTRKGGSVFGPSWPLLREHLAIRRAGLETEATWEDYAAAYRAEMRALYRADPEPLRALAGRGGTLVCYCAGRRCHRFVLADILVSLGAVYEGERETKQERLSREVRASLREIRSLAADPLAGASEDLVKLARRIAPGE